MPETRKVKVIVADDEHIIANTLVTILNKAGFEARAVYSGEKAVEMALSFEPNVLISDVTMAGINGVEAATKVRAKLPSCKFLLISGQATTVDLLRTSQPQINQFEILAKPIHPVELLAKLSYAESA